MGSLRSGIPRFRDSAAQEVINRGIPGVKDSRASKGGEHPRVVLGQPKMNAKQPKRKSAKARKRAQKGTEECKKALPRKNCKQPGLKQQVRELPTTLGPAKTYKLAFLSGSARTRTSKTIRATNAIQIEAA